MSDRSKMRVVRQVWLLALRNGLSDAVRQVDEFDLGLARNVPNCIKLIVFHSVGVAHPRFSRNLVRVHEIKRAPNPSLRLSSVQVANLCQGPVYGNKLTEIRPGAYNYNDDFKSEDTCPLPRLKAARIAFACEKEQIIEIGNTPQGLIIGRVKHIYIADEVGSLDEKGRLNVMAEKVDPLSRLGGTDFGLFGEIKNVPRPK